jgi:hypothetical protein
VLRAGHVPATMQRAKGTQVLNGTVLAPVWSKDPGAGQEEETQLQNHSQGLHLNSGLS